MTTMRTITSLACCVVAHTTVAALSLPSISLPQSLHLGKRETIPAAISIAPSQYWEGDDGPWSTFAVQIGVGAHIQTVRLNMGTSVTSVLTVAAGDGGCPPAYGSNCAQSRGGLYNINQSISYVPNSIYQTGVGNSLGLDFAAVAGFDDVTLGWQGAGGPTVSHTTIFNINPYTFWIGIFGLSPYPTNFTNYVDPQPSFLSALASNNTIPSLSYGYTAGNQYRLNNLKVYGSLTLGGYDINRFQPQTFSFPMYTDISKDLTVTLTDITSTTGNLLNLSPSQPINMFIDSTVPEIWLPEEVCNNFEQAFGLVYDTQSARYLLNSTQRSHLQTINPTINFTISGYEGGPSVVISLPFAAFDLTLTFPLTYNPNSTYYFPLQRAANNTQYTFGRTFLQEAYLIADYDRKNFTVAPCLWDQDKVNNAQIVSILRANETSNGSSNTPSGISGGAIAGIVVGIIAAAAIIGLLLFFFLRRRKTAEKKRRIAELEAKNGASDAGSASPDGQAFMDDNELAGAEIHELTAPQKTHPQELDHPLNGVDPNKVGYSEMAGEFYAPGKDGNPAEMEGHSGIYEMPGSDVHEMPAPVPGHDVKY